MEPEIFCDSPTLRGWSPGYWVLSLTKRRIVSVNETCSGFPPGRLIPSFTSFAKLSCYSLVFSADLSVLVCLKRTALTGVINARLIVCGSLIVARRRLQDRGPASHLSWTREHGSSTSLISLICHSQITINLTLNIQNTYELPPSLFNFIAFLCVCVCVLRLIIQCTNCHDNKVTPNYHKLKQRI